MEVHDLDEEEKELLKEGLNLVRSFKTVGQVFKWVVISFVAVVLMFSTFIDAIKNLLSKLW